MNLIQGKIVSADVLDAELDKLQDRVNGTLNAPSLAVDVVVQACHRLSEKIGEAHVGMLCQLGISEPKARDYLRQAKARLCRDAVMHRLRTELGGDYPNPRTFAAENGALQVTEQICPLGVVTHITAGNQNGLAFFSVIEGLLCGNINIVKLSRNDDGLSLAVLWQLTMIEPRLAPYIYLFDIPSTDTAAMQKLYAVSDAIVVWGGDGAVSAVRRVAPPNLKIIEWGHKLSFAYVNLAGLRDAALTGIARNMVETNQLLCSSCQGIFVDTDSMDELYVFCERFLPLLDRCRLEAENQPSLTVRAGSALRVYSESLHSAIDRPCRVFRGAQANVIAYEDSVLELSALNGNCWVRRLPRDNMISPLHAYKGYLQTVALVAPPDAFDELATMLWRAGVTRVTAGENMSQNYAEAAHDGDYTLRRYTKIASVELPVSEPDLR